MTSHDHIIDCLKPGLLRDTLVAHPEVAARLENEAMLAGESMVQATIVVCMMTADSKAKTVAGMKRRLDNIHFRAG